MNDTKRMYLVIARCNLDDIPMGLFDNEPAANRFASGITTEDVTTTIDAVGWNMDTSELVTIDVIEVVGFGRFVKGQVRWIPGPDTLACDPNRGG